MLSVRYYGVFLTILLSWFIVTAQGTDRDNTLFDVVWQNQSWGEGALYPSGPLWNMVGPFDFDGDGMRGFVTSSSWTGAFLNGVYYYEASGDNQIELRWFYHFADLDTSADNFSSVTVGDLDGDEQPEIIVLADAPAGADGLQIFEWNPDSMSFPTTPTATWNLGLNHGIFEAGQVIAANLDSDANQELVVSVMDGPWGSAGTSHIMIIELQNQSFELPSWHVEFHDSTTTGWSGYTLYTTDLDKDGLSELYAVAWDYYRMLIYENTGNEDEYALQSAFYVSYDDEFSNQGLAAANFDNDQYNELYATSSNGNFWVIADSGDVSQITFDNFHFLGSYSGGLRQIRIDDMDGDSLPDIYLAGNYNEALYDWEYQGGSPLDPQNYNQYTIFQDPTEDDTTSGSDQGYFRVAKLVTGDLDSDRHGDIVIASSSLALDKPTLVMIEYQDVTAIQDQTSAVPQTVQLYQNYPNPFNPATRISYSLPQNSYVKLEIFDMLGRKVITLYNGMQLAGNHHFQWTGVNQAGEPVPSGQYIYRLTINNQTFSKKMTLLK